MILMSLTATQIQAIFFVENYLIDLLIVVHDWSDVCAASSPRVVTRLMAVVKVVVHPHVVSDLVSNNLETFKLR
jgi:hypothetical protein